MSCATLAANSFPHSRPICASSPIPHCSWSRWCPCISSSKAGSNVPSSFDRRLAASLALLECLVSPVVRRRSEGLGRRNLADLDDVLRSETASSSLFTLSSEFVVSGTDADSGALRPILSGTEDDVVGCGRAGNAGGVTKGDSSSETSTSSASRYHFRLLVHRPQPSTPLRLFCHYR